MLFFSFPIIIIVSFFLFVNQRILNSIPEYLSSNVIDDIREMLFLLPENKIINFNNSLINITLYNTSDDYFSYDKMNINFENCLTILQKVYDLDKFFDYSNNDNDEIYKRCFFIIIKIELDRKIIKNNNDSFINNSNFTSQRITNKNFKYIIDNTTKYPTNHIEYLIFNGKNGNLLNTSYCNDLNVKISHPIVNQSGINLNISKDLYEKYKIDVYRTNDSFFNNFCMNYTSDKNTDLTLGQRRNIYFQNVSFCDSNCTYIEVNYTNNMAICACEVKDGIMNDDLLKGGNDIMPSKSFTYDNTISFLNYKVFKCYNEVFNIDRLKKNIGNYISISIILFYTFCLIHFCKNKKRNVMLYFQQIKLMIKNKKLKEENDKNKEINQNTKNNSDNNNSIIGENEQLSKIYEVDKNKSININGIIITDISNPPLKKKLKISSNDKAIKKDNNNPHKNKNIEYLIRSNDNITRDTCTLVHNYGDIKIDTGEELLTKKNEERQWDGIISLKRKNYKSNAQMKNNHYSSFKSNSVLSSTKNNTIKSNDRKEDDYPNTKTITQNNFENYLNLFPSSNYSMEIPLYNMIPSFLKPKTILIKSSKTKNKKNKVNNMEDSYSNKNTQNNFILKKERTKSSNAIYNNFINKNDQMENENANNDENYEDNNINCIIIDDLNRNKCTLRRTREVIRQNKKVKKICKDNKYLRNNNLFFEFDDMKFEIAILIDNRNFCEKFLCEIKDNCIIILLFFRKDIIFKQIKISSFILSCTLDYFFNAFFYSEIYLEQIYEHNKIITFLIDYPKEIFATLASQFLVKLIELLLEDKALSLLLKRIAYQNKYYLKGVNYLLKKYEKRFYIYITIGYLMLGITWYYTCAFCTVYQNSQIKLLYDTLESFVLNLILPFPISFLTVTFRHLAIKKLNKFFFIISNIFRIFS